MIHWGWLVVAFCAGGLAGIFTASFCVIARDADQRMDEMRRQIREEGYHV